MKEISMFFNELRFNSGAIWVESGLLKLSTPSILQNQNTKEFISIHKNKLMTILVGNKIFTKENFYNKEILKDNISDDYLLIFAQGRLWFIEQFEGNTHAYYVPFIYELDSNTDKEGIKYALQRIVNRHEILRSTIEYNNGFWSQRIHNHSLAISETVLSPEDDYLALIKQCIEHPFDLNKEYPIRVNLYIIKPLSITNPPTDKFFLLINIHHIATDAWSKELFDKELFFYYELHIHNTTDIDLPELEIQYKDYAIWQRACLTGEFLENQLRFWKDKLVGYQPLNFPKDCTRSARPDYKGDCESFVLNEEVSQKLRVLAKHYDVSLYSVLLSSVAVLLNKYTGQDDIVVGTLNSNRNHRQLNNLIGFFVNTLVTRIQLSNSESFEELIRGIDKDQLEMQLYQELPFDKLVAEL